jgi:soluble lytic murein transglycosylase-like protein
MSVTAITQVHARIREIGARFEVGPSFGQVLSQAQAASAPAPSAPAAATAVPAATALGSPAPAAVSNVPAGKLPAAAQKWLPHIERIARANKLDPRLLTALVKQESGFRADAGSHAGAIGLTQLMPGTARELGVNPYDPIENLEGGARYLRSQLDRFGSVPLALAAYNAGPGRVAAAGGIPRITETQNYVRNVTAFYADLGGTP